MSWYEKTIETEKPANGTGGGLLMTKGDLGLIAALKEECRFILKSNGWKRLETEQKVAVYERGKRGYKVRLMISGIGGARAKAALQHLFLGFSPATVISLGYGGALDPELGVGELVWGMRVFHWEQEKERLSPGRDMASPPQEILERPPAGLLWRKGFLVSVDRFVEKKRVRTALDPELVPAAVDMETYALSRALEETGIPLLALKAISDELGLEIAPTISRWTDDDLQVQAHRIVRDLIHHPGNIAFFPRLYRRSLTASRSLAMGIRTLLDQWARD
jgi:adenosylhomocysteine nucleosidase